MAENVKGTLNRVLDKLARRQQLSPNTAKKIEDLIRKRQVQDSLARTQKGTPNRQG